jgi:hypothetical protein
VEAITVAHAKTSGRLDPGLTVRVLGHNVGAKRLRSHLVAAVIAFLVWVLFWTLVTFVIGASLQVHFWIVIPILGAVHGLVGGIVFATCLIWEKNRPRSWLRGACYGGLAGAAALLALWLLSYSSIYILCAFPVDVALGAFLFWRLQPRAG